MSAGAVDECHEATAHGRQDGHRLDQAVQSEAFAGRGLVEVEDGAGDEADGLADGEQRREGEGIGETEEQAREAGHGAVLSMEGVFRRHSAEAIWNDPLIARFAAKRKFVSESPLRGSRLDMRDYRVIGISGEASVRRGCLVFAKCDLGKTDSS
jgi:hypothetical protein